MVGQGSGWVGVGRGGSGWVGVSCDSASLCGHAWHLDSIAVIWIGADCRLSLITLHSCGETLGPFR